MFLPVTRSANAADVLILECLLTSNLRSVTFTKKLLYPILEFALRNNVGAARGNHESSITNLSIASTSGDTLQTAAQKSSTILTEFTCFFLYRDSLHPPTTSACDPWTRDGITFPAVDRSRLRSWQFPG